MPQIGNGYVATVLDSDSVYIGGVYNGRNSTTPRYYFFHSEFSIYPKKKKSHRARIPSTNSINITNGELFAAALDIERAAYFRRWSSKNSKKILFTFYTNYLVALR